MSGSRLWDALQSSAIAMALCSPEGQFVAVNPAMCRMMRRTEVELLSSSWQDITHPDDLDADAALAAQILAGERDTYRLTKRYLTPAGDVIHGDLSAACVRHPGGDLDYLIKQIVDITENVATQERFRLLAENSADLIALAGNDGIMTWVSPSATRLFLRRPEDLIGVNAASLVHPDDLPTMKAAREELLAGRAIHVEMRMERGDGQFRWFDFHAQPVLDDSGVTTGRIVAVRPATGKEQRDRLNAALAAELDPHAFLDAVRVDGELVDVVFVEANAAAEEYMGMSRDEIIGTRMLERFPGSRDTGLWDRYASVIETGRPVTLDEALLKSQVTGMERNFDVRMLKVGDGLTITWRDVTDRVHARRRLEASEARYRLLAENASDVVFRGNTDAVIEWVSPSVRQVLGLEPDDVIGRHVMDLVEPADIEVIRAASAQVNEGGRTSYRARFRRSDDTSFWAEVEARPAFDDSGAVVGRIGSLHDVDDQVRAEQTVRAAETRYRFLSESASDAIVGFDSDVRVSWAWGSVEAITGWTPDELIGMSGYDLYLWDEGEIARNRAIVAAGGTTSGHIRVRRKDGGTHWVDRRSHQRSDDDGNLVEYVSSWRDAQAEMEVRDQLAETTDRAVELSARYESARNEALEANLAKTAFLSRMSHELRTPLNAVLGFAQLLDMDDLTQEQHDGVHQILKGGAHLLDLISEVLDISRIESGRLPLSLEPVAVVDAVAEALDLVRLQAAQSGVTLDLSGASACTAHVRADRQRLIQVLTNLLSNAVKYNRPGGLVYLSCSHHDDGMLALHVADTGIGISEENLSRLFRPFERLGAAGSPVEGTGIGLALAHALTTAMGGRIDVTSTLGEGSDFALLLPEVDAVSVNDDVDQDALSVPDPPHGCRVLYIEDNPANLHLMERIAGLRANVELECFDHGIPGLARALEAPPDLVLLDLQLPDLSGEQILRQLRESPQGADVPVVIVTADASAVTRKALVSLGCDGLLPKPIDVHEVLAWMDDPRQMRG